MIDAVPGVDEARKQRLMAVLDVDPEWRMHQVSDGQRRRVQICVGLLRPFKVRRELAGLRFLLNGVWWAGG
jgi:CCR4-NOT complex subunit CAF16